jgi:hypothetical protein
MLIEKVVRIKILGRSIIKHYQIQLLKDVADMKLNYVEICMGNE